MKFAVRLVVCVVIILFAAPKLSAQSRAEASVLKQKDGVLIFMEGIALSYAGHHERAQAKFAEYGKLHPGNLLVAQRVLYDRFMRFPGGKLNDGAQGDEYREELKLVSEAIGKFEEVGCNSTDIKVLAEDTLDCEYVAASLYSFRMTLVGRNDSWFKVGGDKTKFFFHASRSKSLQAKFLLGICEYVASEQSFFKKAGLKIAGVPTNRQHAISLIKESLRGNAGPFADDISFFLFDAQCRSEDSCGKDAKEFAEEYPLNQLHGYLTARYPANKKLLMYRPKQ